MIIAESTLNAGVKYVTPVVLSLLVVVGLIFPIEIFKIPIFLFEIPTLILITLFDRKTISASAAVVLAILILYNPFPLIPDSLLIIMLSIETVFFLAFFYFAPRATVVEIILVFHILMAPLIFIVLIRGHDNFTLAAWQSSRFALNSLVCVSIFQIIDVGLRWQAAKGNIIGKYVPRGFSTKYAIQVLSFVMSTSILIVLLANSLRVADIYKHDALKIDADNAVLTIIHNAKTRASTALAAVGRLEEEDAIDTSLELSKQGFDYFPLALDAFIIRPDRVKSELSISKITNVVEKKQIERAAQSLQGEQITVLNISPIGPVYLLASTTAGDAILTVRYQDTASFIEDIKATTSPLTKSIPIKSFGFVDSEGTVDSLAIRLDKDYSMYSQSTYDIRRPSLGKLRDTVNLLSSYREGFGYVVFSPSEEVQNQYKSTFQNLENLRVEKDAWPYYVTQAEYIATAVYLGIFGLALMMLVTEGLIHWAFPETGKRLLSDMNTSDFSDEEYMSHLVALSAQPQVVTELEELRQTSNSLIERLSSVSKRRKRQLESFEDMLSHMPIGVIGVDDQITTRYVNEKLSMILLLHKQAFDQLKLLGTRLDTGSEAHGAEVTAGDGRKTKLLVSKIDRYNETGDSDGFWLIVVDVTEAKLREEQLAQTSKLATLGKMATEIAHELNQPLNILNLAHANLRKLIDTEELDRQSISAKLNKCKIAIDRASRIINHMRSYGRVIKQDVVAVDVRGAISGALTLTADQMALHGLKISVNMPDQPVMILADLTKFEQVILNILSNSKDAILSNGASSEISIGMTIESGKVIIRIADTGGGMADAELYKIFEPFYTSKSDGHGTGLGGSISYGIIKDLGGTILARNIPGGLEVAIQMTHIAGAPEIGIAAGMPEVV